MFTPLTFGVALFAAIVIIPRIIEGALLRASAFIILGAVAVYTGFAPLWIGVGIALIPEVVGLISMLYFYWLGQRALSGKMGEPQKWMAELVRDDNVPFIEALENLDRTDVKEIAVIADNKQELKELALKRAKEKLD